MRSQCWVSGCLQNTKGCAATEETLEAQLGRMQPVKPQADVSCSAELRLALQDKVARFLERKEAGFSIAQAYRKHRDYSNPQFLEKMIDHFGVDQYGTCFAPDVFCPTSLPREDYFDRSASAYAPELWSEAFACWHSQSTWHSTSSASRPAQQGLLWHVSQMGVHQSPGLQR